MNQPVPAVNASDVDRVLRRDFPPELHEKALALLSTYGTEDRHHEVDRVRLAVLKLADGDLEALRREIEVAKCDYRDVLASAEYPEYMRAVPPGDDLSGQRAREVVARDWAQYRAWLDRR